MEKVSAEIKSKLLKLNQRLLTKGELFLLAKVISDSIPLAQADNNNVKLFTLQYKYNISNALYYISDYTYLDTDNLALVYKLIDDIYLWRFTTAYTPATPFFNSQGGTVIDDLSCLTKFIDVTYMCAINDIIQDANYMFTLFKELIKYADIAAIKGGTK